MTAPAEPEHVAAFIKGTLKAAGWFQADLARRTGLSAKHINQIMQRRVAISPEIAMLFERHAGFDAVELLTIQARWQVHQLRATDTSAGEPVTDDRTWRTGDPEPGPEIDLLVDTAHPKRPYLARVPHGWIWTTGRSERDRSDKDEQRRPAALVWTFATSADNERLCQLRLPSAAEREAWDSA